MLIVKNRYEKKLSFYICIYRDKPFVIYNQNQGVPSLLSF